jgi:uncharacterized protein (TIGR02145 family)
MRKSNTLVKISICLLVIVISINPTISNLEGKEVKYISTKSRLGARFENSYVMYSEVTIGKQIWMASNLNTAKFRNGDSIQEVKTIYDFQKADAKKEPAFCKINSESFAYNWYAINDPRGFAPKGWHIPSDNEWTQLTDNLGGLNIAGKKMKSMSDWKSHPRTFGTNDSGFSAIPDKGGYTGFFWSSTENSMDDAWALKLTYDYDYAYRVSIKKRVGCYVRCVKD